MKNYELIAARSRNGLTQEAMAKKMGVTIQSYNAKELGVRKFTLKDVEKIVGILNLSLEDVDRIFFKHKLTKRIS